VRSALTPLRLSAQMAAYSPLEEADVYKGAIQIEYVTFNISVHFFRPVTKRCSKRVCRELTYTVQSVSTAQTVLILYYNKTGCQLTDATNIFYCLPNSLAEQI
jgi:hypothetical protein